MTHPFDDRTLGFIISGRMPWLEGDSFSAEEWDLLTANAHAEGMAPLLYWTLSKSGKFSSLPQSARNFLRLAYSGTWMQNEKLLKELEVLAQEFHQAGISVVVLKGVCFALTIYPDIGLRPMGDMDALVPGERLEDAVRIARSLGYVDAAPEASPGLNALLSHHVCLQKSGPGMFILEIHDRLAGEEAFTYSVPVDWFWEQAIPLETSSPRKFTDNLLMLTPAAQVLYASAHAMLQHRGDMAPLRWFYDLDRLICHYDRRLDWKLLLSQAREFEWGSALEAALDRTAACFDTPIPAAVRASLAERSDRHRDLVQLKQSRPATHILLELEKLSSLNWHGRVRLFLALLIPSPAYMRWRYRLRNSWQLLVYYPYRWWVIIKDAARTLMALLKGLSAS